MAKIYKIDGYVVCPDDDKKLDINNLLYNNNFFAFMYRNESEDIDLDNVEINLNDDYWKIDKIYSKLAYDRVVEELKEPKNESKIKN